MKIKAFALSSLPVAFLFSGIPSMAHVDDNDILWYTKPILIRSVTKLETSREGISVETLKTPSSGVQTYRPMPAAPIPLVAEPKVLPGYNEPYTEVSGELKARSVSAVITTQNSRSLTNEAQAIKANSQRNSRLVEASRR